MTHHASNDTAYAVADAVLRPRSWRWHVLVTAIWAAALVSSTRLALTGGEYEAALIVHILGLVVGLGAVVLVDWYGLAWMSGHREFQECVRLGEAAHPLIWLGLSLLLVSGAGLAPDLDSSTGVLKQVLVLLLLNNGVALRPLSKRLRQVPSPKGLADLPIRLRARVVSTLTVSQLSWWGAAGIGFLSASTNI